MIWDIRKERQRFKNLVPKLILSVRYKVSKPEHFRLQSWQIKYVCKSFCLITDCSYMVHVFSCQEKQKKTSKNRNCSWQVEILDRICNPGLFTCRNTLRGNIFIILKLERFVSRIFSIITVVSWVFLISMFEPDYQGNYQDQEQEGHYNSCQNTNGTGDSAKD